MARTKTAFFRSPLGGIELEVRDGKLVSVRLGASGDCLPGGETPEAARGFLRALRRYFGGVDPGVEAEELDLSGATDFQSRVFDELMEVPRGEVVTYGELAGRVGVPGGARAIGQAVGRNPLPIFVPCHRVVAAGRAVGGFGAGTGWKKGLLAQEGWKVEEGSVVRDEETGAKRCVYAGSFDPPTTGHMYMVERGAELFEHLIVAVGINPHKRYTFSVEERLEMLRACTEEMDSVEVDSFESQLLVRYAESKGAGYILRGIRSDEDYRFEHTMRNVNEDLASGVTTVFLIPPREICEISSSFVKGLVGFEGWKEVVEPYVPEPVYEKLIVTDIRWSERTRGPEGGTD